MQPPLLSSPRWALLLLCGCACYTGVEPGADMSATDEGPNVTIIGEAELVEALAGGARLPIEFIAQGLPPHERPAPSFAEIEARLASDPEFRPLDDALAAAGWHPAERSALVFVGAAHGSFQPHDPLRHRQLAIRGDFTDALKRFRDDLAAYEVEHNVKFDREAMARLGIFTELEPAELIP